jgi:hypothetical protein
MHLDSRIRALIGAAAAVGLLTALAAGGSASAATATKSAGGCTPATNIEAIIDDSGSMDFTDPSKFRTTLLDAFAALQQNQGKTLGGVEFGDTADVLFAPAPIPGVVPAMDASFALVNADNGSTDYNLAFQTATSANPNANGRIFLSDGGHNVGTYNNGHNSPRVKTDTVGFGSVDPALLNQIAADTGGVAFNLTSSSLVPAVAAGITADMNCKAPPLTFTDAFGHQGQVSPLHGFKATSRTADILETYDNPASVLAVIGLTSSGKGAKGSSSSLAQTARKRGGGKVKSTTKAGKGFVAVHLRGLKPGSKIKFRVKATSLAGPTTGTASVIR